MELSRESQSKGCSIKRSEIVEIAGILYQSLRRRLRVYFVIVQLLFKDSNKIVIDW